MPNTRPGFSDRIMMRKIASDCPAASTAFEQDRLSRTWPNVERLGLFGGLLAPLERRLAMARISFRHSRVAGPDVLGAAGGGDQHGITRVAAVFNL